MAVALLQTKKIYTAVYILDSRLVVSDTGVFSGLALMDPHAVRAG